MPAAALAGGAMVGGMWLPWFHSGQAGRNSFAAFRAAQVLGIEWITPYRVAWFLLPVILAAAVAAWALGGRRLGAGVLLILGAVLTLAAGAAIWQLGAEAGSAATASAGLCTTVLSALVVSAPRAH